jgi:demethylmacrocin O-methyltransferase
MLAEVRPKLDGPGPHDLGLLMAHYGTDKFYVHHFEHEYERHFAPLRDKPLRLLEIGIGGYESDWRGGDSIKVWRDYFRSGQIFGLDIHDKSHLDDDRITTIKGSQSDHECLADIDNGCGPFDIVIDDGSHVQLDILVSFETLFPLLAPGGIYVVEDLWTAYVPAYGGHALAMNKQTSINLITGLIDAIHDSPSVMFLGGMVKSVHVSKNIAFIYKY